jgi:uncharacterized membrane protein
MQNQKSALGLDGNVTALIGYIIGIVALVEFFIEKDNKFAKFHAMQSVLLHVVMWVVFVVLMIASFIIGLVVSMASSALASLVGIVFLLIFLVWGLAYFGGVILGAIKSFGGAMFKFPIIGNMAEKWS